jgi:hypothetical protein
MLWSLNRMTFRKYLGGGQFRDYLNGRMLNPSRQLLFHDNVPSDCVIENDFTQFTRTSSIACISIRNNPHLIELPSSSGLQLLSLCRCLSLKKIGDYLNLKTLQIDQCPCLNTVGILVSLHSLRLIGQESRLSQFPLEQIETLHLGYIRNSFFGLSHRLAGLKYLSLSGSWEYLTFFGGSFPNLIELHVHNFSSVQLTGMTSLLHLVIRSTPTSQIFGKEEVYPRLKSFSSDEYLENDQFIPTVLKNATHLSLQVRKSSVKSDFLLSVNEKVISIDIYMEKQKIHIPFRYFEMLNLRFTELDPSSSLSKIQILVLNGCLSIKDISPCKNIPYLQLKELSGVQNFACLGNQRYLIIESCPGLSGEAVGKIRKCVSSFHF